MAIGGGGSCTQPYRASVFNISAMSFGALSANAVRALNAGAKRGGFAHDTGEGSISAHHRVHGGDLIWEIGSGYFGCRNAAGRFDPEKFAALCAETPAVHRFPGSMAKRLQDLARVLVDDYHGDAAAIWQQGNPDGREILIRLKRLPGFGEQKARIFLALLGKQYGLKAPGWREAAGDYGKAGTHMSVADVVDKGSLEQVRAYKKKMKAAAKAKA